MLHIQPITEEKANGHILEIYQDIKRSLQVSIVPLLFLYLANFEEYFDYVWGKIKNNIYSEYFQQSVKETLSFSEKELETIYIPSHNMVLFTTQLHEIEKSDLLDTVGKLGHLNAKLLMLTIGMREGLKGVHVKEELLLKEHTDISKDFFQTFSNIVTDSTKKEAEVSSRVLAPLFGSSALAFSHYSDFFSRVSDDMDKLVTTEDYLTKRVMLEHQVLKKVEGLLPLGCSYAEVARYAMGKPHFGELLYILTETFPSQFPRMLFTSLVMERSLTYQPQAMQQI